MVYVIVLGFLGMGSVTLYALSKTIKSEKSEKPSKKSNKKDKNEGEKVYI